MIRILQCVNNMHRAGLETMLMNYYRNIDRDKIQFDFLVHRQEHSDYDDEIESLGGRIYRAPRLYPQNYPAYFRYMKQLFQEHPEYKIVHSHIDAMSLLPLLAAKRAGIPNRIAHSHSTSIEDRGAKRIVKQIFRYMLPKAANYQLACGEQAGKFLFRSRNYEIIPNAVDASKFLFSHEVRNRKRIELGIQDEFIIGHVGRFTYVKNHPFLIEIFCEVLKRKPNSKLLLVGTGPDEENICALAESKNVKERVIFLGSRNDTHELYQAMDVFAMPSLYEGVPVVGIEAQFSGLPCIFSDRVPEEVAFTDRCRFEPLNLGAEQWARILLDTQHQHREEQTILFPKYDVRQAQQILADYYQALKD